MTAVYLWLWKWLRRALRAPRELGKGSLIELWACQVVLRQQVVRVHAQHARSSCCFDVGEWSATSMLAVTWAVKDTQPIRDTIGVEYTVVWNDQTAFYYERPSSVPLSVRTRRVGGSRPIQNGKDDRRFSTVAICINAIVLVAERFAALKQPPTKHDAVDSVVCCHLLTELSQSWCWTLARIHDTH